MWKCKLRCRCFTLALVAVPAFFQTGCRTTKEESGTVSAESSPNQPHLLSVRSDQLARLRLTPVRNTTWSIKVSTTGTVDWDADHTTQAITQVNGPISRILVDLGSPVQQGRAAALRLQPRCRQRHRDLSRRRAIARAYNKRIVDRMKELLDRGAVAQKDYESSEGRLTTTPPPTCRTACRRSRSSASPSQEFDQAEKQGVAISTELAVRSPIAGMVVQKLVSPGRWFRPATPSAS